MDITSSPYSVKWYMDNMRSGQITVNEDYQRRGVWLTKHRAESFVGKQFSQLDAPLKRDIWDYKITAQIVQRTESLDAIRGLFLRLNRTNLSLNPQELRHAEFNGEFIKLSLDLADSLPIWKTYNVFAEGDKRRMLDVQFCSTLLTILRFGVESETQHQMNQAYDRFNETYPQKDQDRETILRMAAIVDQFLDADSRLASKRSIIYTLFTLAHKFVEKGLDVRPDQVQAWREFCQEYLSDEASVEVEEFKALAVEGNNKKAHRLGRLAILERYLSS